MDPVTHTLYGACLSRAAFNRKTALSTLTFALAAEAPDIDVVLNLGGDVFGFAHHRGYTHTFIGLPLIAGAVVALVYGTYRLLLRYGKAPKTKPRWKLLYGYALLAGVSHILLDYTNQYGVRPFMPFDYKWYSWDIVFIIEPFMLLVMVLALVGPALFGLVSSEIGARKEPRGRGMAITALVLIAAMWGYRDQQHRLALAALDGRTYSGESAFRSAAYPYPLNPFHWNGVIETSTSIRSVDVLARTGEVDADDNAEIRYRPEETAVLQAAKASSLGRAYLDWAVFPITEIQKSTGRDAEWVVTFYDMRFLYAGSLTIPGRSQVPLTSHVELDRELKVVRSWFGSTPPD